MAQAFTYLGRDDPRLNKYGKIDFRLSRLVRSWKKDDGPSQRKRPVPKAVLSKLTQLATTTGARQQRVAQVDLMWIGFFFLLRPSEYLCTRTQHHFTLQDVILRIGTQEFRGHTVPLAHLDRVTSAGFEFVEQKNGISGDIVMLGTTSDSYVGPSKCLIRRIRHIRGHTDAPDTPLFLFWDEHNVQRRVTDRVLTQDLRFGAGLLSLDNTLCTVGALRCTGATALLNSQVPPDLIKLVGRWRSDEVFRYLHLQSSPLTSHLAEAMITNY